MVRKNRDGKHIISAGEVGVYTVCPEAWRLQYVFKKRTLDNDDTIKGRELHENWANNYSDAIGIVKMARKIVILVIFTMFLIAILMYFESPTLK